MSISVADFYCGFYPFQCSGVTSIVDVTQVALTLVRVSIEGSHDDLIPKAKFGALLIISLPRVQRKFSKLQRRNALLDHCLVESLMFIFGGDRFRDLMACNLFMILYDVGPVSSSAMNNAHHLQVCYKPVQSWQQQTPNSRYIIWKKKIRTNDEKKKLGSISLTPSYPHHENGLVPVPEACAFVLFDGGASRSIGL